MARTEIPTYTTNQLITAAHGNTYWKDNEAAHWSEINADCVMATRSAAQAIADDTTTEILWDTEAYDHGGLHSLASNTGRLTAVKAGIYAYSFNGNFASHQTQYRWASVYKNGSGGTKLAYIANSAGVWSGVFCLAGEIDLGIGDYLVVLMYHNAGVSLNFERISDRRPNFCMHYIRPS